jgi:hypothetical protein
MEFIWASMGESPLDGFEKSAVDKERNAAFARGMDDFFDPAVDQHSAFYIAMERDKHAAHLVAGTSFLDLNTMIFKTECNNAYESMNEDDMQRIRKLMWEVWVPNMSAKFKNSLPASEEPVFVGDFQRQMHVVHISVRVAQALQLVFELNQKKSFSAVARTAYEVALQDCLYHPHIKKKFASSEYPRLINFLRRHPTYSTPFNTYVGYKLLRQQLVRGGGAGTNRKSNDAERLHDEAANRLWSVFDENRGLFAEYGNAAEQYKMEWHHLYYKEVADTLFKKISDSAMTERITDDVREKAQDFVESRNVFEERVRAENMDSVKSNNTDNGALTVGSGALTVGSGVGIGALTLDSGVGIGALGAACVVTDGYNSQRNSTPSMEKRIGVDIFSAIQDSRDTVLEGTTKRVASREINSDNDTPVVQGIIRGGNTRDPSPTKRQRKT